MSKSENRFVDYKIVKANVSIVQILERYGLMQKLRRLNDDQYTGTCPIHHGQNKTSFRISISKNCWKCFSQCQCGGNILDFVARMENVPMHKAALLIAEWFNVEEAFEVPIERERTIAEAVTSSKKDSATAQTKENGSAAAPEEDESITENKPLGFELKNLDAAHPYLQQRGLSAETIATFGLGFCKKGSMANHVVVPVHNGAGQLVAYAGRWPGETPPNPDEKYKLPKGFRKTLEVFNLHRAMQADVSKPLIVVEGFFDCMKLWQAGKKRTVSVMGSSVSESQAGAIVKAAGLDPKIVLLFDEDEAGREGRKQALLRFASKAYVKVVELGVEGLQPDQLTDEQVAGLQLEEQAPPYGAQIAKFRAGKIVATPNALDKVPEDEIALALGRHLRGDWGDLCEADRLANEQALTDRMRLLSVYRTRKGVKFYLITEADRSATTILLPCDY